MYYLIIWTSDIDFVAVFDKVSILSYTLPVQLYTPWVELIILSTTWAPYKYLYNFNDIPSFEGIITFLAKLDLSVKMLLYHQDLKSLEKSKKGIK